MCEYVIDNSDIEVRFTFAWDLEWSQNLVSQHRPQNSVSIFFRTPSIFSQDLQEKMERPVGKYDEEEERWDGGDEEEHPEQPTIDLFIFIKYF